MSLFKNVYYFFVSVCEVRVEWCWGGVLNPGFFGFLGFFEGEWFYELSVLIRLSYFGIF